MEVYCTPLETFLEKVKGEISKAPETVAESKDKNSQEENPIIEMEFDFKMKIPQYCSNYKIFTSDKAWNACKWCINKLVDIMKW